MGKITLDKILNGASWRMKHYWPKVLNGTYLRQEEKNQAKLDRKRKV